MIGNDWPLLRNPAYVRLRIVKGLGGAMFEQDPGCRMCGTALGDEPFSVREMMFGTQDRFDYHQCAACGSLQISAIPDDLGRYYPATYYSMTADANGSSIRGRVRAALVKVALYLYFSGDGAFRAILPAPERGDVLALAAAGVRRRHSVLDLGCGSNPFLLNLLSQIGFTHLTGADPFLDREGRAANGVRLLKRDISEIQETFDVVLLNHSLEHVIDPQKDLTALAKVMAPGGRSVVRLPTPSSAAFEMYGADWVQLDAPRHLNLPSRKAMELMVERAGLSIIRVFDDSTDLQFWGSELYKMNVALMSGTARARFSAAEIDRFKIQADTLNRQGRGDQVTYILAHRPGTAPRA